MIRPPKTHLGLLRLVLTTVTIVVVLGICVRQVPAQCQTGVGLFDYGPHRDDVMAEYLAMGLSGALRAPDYEYDRIHRDLELIRSTIPAMRLLYDWFPYIFNQIEVGFEVGLPLQGYDQLNTFYQVIDDSEYSHAPGIHVLTFCDTLNIPALVPEYEALPEVEHAMAFGPIGGGDSVSMTPIGTTYRYEFVHGSGDCMSGCICRQYWTVDVLEDGCVTEVLSWDEGWCEACCRGGDCERVFGGCSGDGGTVVDECLGDSDGDGSDDACATWSEPVPPEPDVIPDTGGIMVNSTKGRYLSFYTTAAAGRDQALRVTLTDLPAPFDQWNGRSLWVGEPGEAAPAPCGTFPVPPRVMVATLRCGSPTYRNWADVGVVHVYHEAIIPDGTYHVEVVDAEFSSIFSDPLEMTTAKWGDTVETCSTVACTPPDGSVDIVDALAILRAFAFVPGSIILPRADLEPACVDFQINISDVLHSLRGFTGQAYPFTPSATDPCDATCAGP